MNLVNYLRSMDVLSLGKSHLSIIPRDNRVTCRGKIPLTVCLSTQPWSLRGVRYIMLPWTVVVLVFQVCRHLPQLECSPSAQLENALPAVQAPKAYTEIFMDLLVRHLAARLTCDQSLHIILVDDEAKRINLQLEKI